MKKSLNPTLMLCLSLCLVGCGNSENSPMPVAGNVEEASNVLFADLAADGDPAEKTFQTLDGRGFDVDFFAGQKVFINFWATWCAPCIREIPSINRAAAALEDEGYLFVFVSDEDNDTIENFLMEREFDGNFIKLNGYFATFGIGAVPSSWLLDENGDVTATWAGAYEWDSAEMLAEIRNPSPPDRP
jgi:thiol-disulfide isomerase/thioredoxin